MAFHEIGHALGLDHSTVETSVMFPYFSSATGEAALELTDDDIKGIQAHYGSSQTEEEHSTRRMPNGGTSSRITSAPRNDRCVNLNPEQLTGVTHFHVPDSNFFVFGNQIFRFSEHFNSTLPGYPKALSEVFPNGPTSVSSFLTLYRQRRQTAHVYVFQVLIF